MQFTVRKASDWNFKETIEINSLEELIQFVEEKYSTEHSDWSEVFKDISGVIISKDKENNWELQIYDNYIE